MHKIAWLNIPGYIGETLNPVMGCTPISSGCSKCYCREMISRFSGAKGWPNSPDQVTLFPERLHQIDTWRKPRAVFLPSMGDLFHPDVPWNFQYKVLERILLNPEHIFIALTKRPILMKEAVAKVCYHLHRNYPKLLGLEVPIPNLWLGISAENQKTLNIRLRGLLETMAVKRIVSVEPMLSDVSLVDYHKEEGLGCYSVWIDYIDWVLVGAETGAGARPMDLKWARRLQKDCQLYDTPFFMKQISGKEPIPADLMVREFPNFERM